MPDIDAVWQRIAAHANELFTMEDGSPLGYTVVGDQLRHNRSKIPLSKAVFARALDYVPLDSPSHLARIVTGSAYVYTILMDPRIRKYDW